MMMLLIFFCYNRICYAGYQCPSFCRCRSTTIIECNGETTADADIMKLFMELPRECVLFSLSKINITMIDTRLFSTVYPQLKELKLEANQLKRVPENLSGVFPSLERLQLTTNQITSVGQADFAGLRELVALRIDNNKLVEIRSDTFKSNSKLTSLFLESNLIDSISTDAFKGLDKLTSLMLNDNKLKNLPKGAFKGFKNRFMQINLARNRIEHIPKSLFAVNQSYVFLDLSDNMISTIDENAFQEISIGVLNLRNNKLTSLSSKMFETLSFKSINLMNNPVRCDCTTIKILRQIEQNREGRQIKGVCNSPAVVRGIALQNLVMENTTEQLNCTVCDTNNTCKNNGKCVGIDDQTDEIKCECLPGYSGKTCQNILPASTSPDGDGEGGSSMTPYILIASVVLGILLMLAVVACCYLRGRRRSQQRQNSKDTMSGELLHEEKFSEGQ